MHRLIPVNSGCFAIRFDDAGTAIPFQRGDVVPKFERSADGRMALRDNQDINSPVINFQPYGDYINDNTGLPFATFDELVAFTQDYIFKRSDTPSPEPSTIVKQFNIVASPAAPNEKPAGDTLQDASIGTLNVLYMMINQDIYVKGITLTQTDDTLETDGDPATFSIGDVVTVTGIQIP